MSVGAGFNSDVSTDCSAPIARVDRAVIQPIVMKSRIIKQSASVALPLLGGCLIWSLWPALASMANRWSTDPRYAHGYFVPIFSLALLWMRRARLDGVQPGKSTWGLALVVLGAAIQLVGGYFRIGALEGLALLPYVGGLALLLGGWRILDWAWPSIGFLAFMIPLPWRIENALGPPLQFYSHVGQHVPVTDPRFHGVLRRECDPVERGADRGRGSV